MNYSTAAEIEACSGLYEDYREQKYALERLKERYSDYPVRLLVEDVIRCGRDINDAVPNGGFPAFDIAIKLYTDADVSGGQIHITPKQQQALINVLANYKVRHR